MEKTIKEQLLAATGDFTYMWGQTFFIQAECGNFVWEDPSYNGDNTMRKYSGTYDDFVKEIGVPYGRGKGVHFISEYCGTEFTVIE